MADEPRLFIAIYTDEDISSKLAPALRERGFDAQSTVEASMLNASDEAQLAYATDHGMALLTCNTADLTRLAKQYAENGQSHSGIIVSSEQYGRRHVGELLRQVLRLVNTVTADDLRDCLVYLEQYKEAGTGESRS
jgi:hypothetical protein